MKVKKPVKKAQSGSDSTKAKLPSSKVAMKTVDDRFVDSEVIRRRGPSDKIDTAARKKAIKEGKFYEDPKSGDLFPVKKKAKGGAKVAKKAKFGAKMMKSIKKSIKKKK